MEKQVTSRIISERLKALGVEQESYFYWSKAMDGKFWRIENKEFFAVDKRRDVSAFLASEIGEMLYPVHEKDFIRAYGEIFYVPTTNVMTALGFIQMIKSPDLLAKMLEYLIQNKMI